MALHQVGLRYSVGTDIPTRGAPPCQIRQIVREPHQPLVQRRIVCFRQLDDTKPGSTKLPRFPPIEANRPYEPSRLARARVQDPLFVHSNIAAEENPAWVGNGVFPLHRVPRGAAIKQVLVGQPLVWVLRRGVEMIQVKGATGAAPLLSEKTKNTLKGKFIPEPGSETVMIGVAPRPMPAHE